MFSGVQDNNQKPLTSYTYADKPLKLRERRPKALEPFKLSKNVMLTTFEAKLCKAAPQLTPEPGSGIPAAEIDYLLN